MSPRKIRKSLRYLSSFLRQFKKSIKNCSLVKSSIPITSSKSDNVLNIGPILREIHTTSDAEITVDGTPKNCIFSPNQTKPIDRLMKSVDVGKMYTELLKWGLKHIRLPILP